MTKKTVKKNRGATVDLETFLTTSSTVDSWAEEMEGEPTTTTTATSSASTASTGLTLEELRANSDASFSGHQSRFGGSSGGYGHRENQFSRELSSNVAKVKPSSFYSEGAPQRSSSSSYNESPSFGSGERRERKQYPQNELPTERPFVCFVGNLTFTASKEELAEFFNDAPINISLPKDRETQRPKGYGYVEFDNVEDMKSALSLNGETFASRPIKIDIASPDTAAKVSVDNKDSFRGGNRREGGFRRDNEEDYERRAPPSVADKSDNWRTGGDLDVNPFGNKKKDAARTTHQESGAFGSFSATRRTERSEETRYNQPKAKPSPFGEGKAWEPKEKDLKSFQPNLEILASKKGPKEVKTHQKKETQGETQEEGEFQTATSKQRGGRRYAQQSTRGGISNNKRGGGFSGKSSRPSNEEEEQDNGTESKNQYAALSQE